MAHLAWIVCSLTLAPATAAGAHIESLSAAEVMAIGPAYARGVRPAFDVGGNYADELVTFVKDAAFTRSRDPRLTLATKALLQLNVAALTLTARAPGAVIHPDLRALLAPRADVTAGVELMLKVMREAPSRGVRCYADVFADALIRVGRDLALGLCGDEARVELGLGVVRAVGGVRAAEGFLELVTNPIYPRDLGPDHAARVRELAGRALADLARAKNPAQVARSCARVLGVKGTASRGPDS